MRTIPSPMPDQRSPCVTPLRPQVTAWVPKPLLALFGVLCVGLLLAFPAPASAEEPLASAEERVDTGRLLLEAARGDLPLSRRLLAAGRALAAPGTLDPELALRAGTRLLAEAPAPAGWLILRATDTGWTNLELRTAAVAALATSWPAATGTARARLGAIGLLLGRRGKAETDAVASVWPASDFVMAVLRREIGYLRDGSGTLVLEGGAEAVRRALTEVQAAADHLDDAQEDEPAVMRRGLDALRKMGSAAVPLLLHEAATGAAGEPAGRMPRAVRAIVALGMIRDPAATPVLARCLASPDGWVRVAAANALGDLGDPAAAVPLAVHLATLGDLFRSRDQWDYPGVSETNVTEEAWRRIDYFVVDAAAADALLRLGVPAAAGYLIHEKLDPSKNNSRIRVFQDAVDALRRSVPVLEVDHPEKGYNVDAGLPQRDKAFTRLAFLWHEIRDRQDLVSATFDEKNAGFRKAARALADRLRGTDVRTFMITKPAIGYLGRVMTPTLIDTIAVATRGSARAELAEALGLVRDPRAIPTLIGLLEDKRPYVRSRAAEALGAYVGTSQDARDALVKTLAERKQGPRLSALKGLVGSRWDAALLAAYRANQPERVSKDWALTSLVFLLVQEGPAHWDKIEAGLRDEQRYVREAYWHLLRAALDWPAFLHDAKAKPDAKRVRRITKEAVLKRLQARRSP